MHNTDVPSQLNTLISNLRNRRGCYAKSGLAQFENSKHASRGVLVRRGVENGAPRGGGHGGTITSRGAPLLPRRPAHRRLLLAARTRGRRRDHWWLRRPPLRRRGWRRQRVGLAVSAPAPAAGEAAAPTARIDRRTSRSPCHPSAHPEVTSMAATYCDNLTRSAWVQQVSLQQASAQATRRT